MAGRDEYAMITIRIVPSQFHKWHGTLLVDDEKLHALTGPRPGCVARDLLNWMQYNVMQPTQEVVLEVTTYE